MNKLKYSHEEFLNDLHKLVRDIHLSGFMPDYVIGIARGGSLPAIFLSHYLNKPYELIHLSFLDSDKLPSEINIVEQCGKLLHLNRWGKKLLIVDDICDTGKTLKEIKTELGTYHELNKFLTLHYNSDQDLFKPDFYVTELHKKTNPIWVEYYYEKWWKN